MQMENLWYFFSFLEEVEKSIEPEQDKQVMIEKAINLKLMCDYVVSCSYGDVVLIICMLHDYVKMLDEARGDDIQYQAYYRVKFLKMANRLAEQIGYDYELAVEKCKKKQLKQEADSDIGEEAMALTIKRGMAKNKESNKEVNVDEK